MSSFRLLCACSALQPASGAVRLSSLLALTQRTAAGVHPRLPLLTSARSGSASRSSGWRPLTLGGERGFHTSRPRPTLFWFMSAKVAAAVLGRYFGRWWRRQPKGEQGGLGARWGVAGLAGAWLCILAAAYYHSHVQETPLTRRRRCLALTPAQMSLISRAEHQRKVEALQSQGRLLPASDPSFPRLLAVTRRLLDAARPLVEGEELPWTLHIVRDSSVNASTDQNGNIFVHTGLLDFVGDSDDQLAVVLGHELAHTLLMHQMEKLSFIRLMDWLVIVSMAAIWTLIPKDGIAVVTQWFFRKVTKIVLDLPYSRMLEREADKVGMLLAAKACYDVRWQEVVWARMRLHSLLKTGGEKLEWLSTHPLYSRRQADVRFYLPKVLAGMCSECGPLPTADPMEPIRAEEAKVNNYVTAVKSYQNLKRMPKEESKKMLSRHIVEEMSKMAAMEATREYRRSCRVSPEDKGGNCLELETGVLGDSPLDNNNNSDENNNTETDTWTGSWSLLALLVALIPRLGKRMGPLLSQTTSRS